MCFASTSLVAFTRVDEWSEDACLSDASLFVDGFLYISCSSTKATLDRRGRDGESKCHFAKSWQVQSIHQSVCKQYKLQVCQRSSPVKRWSINQCQSVSCQAANHWIRTASSPVETINKSVFQMGSASVLWEVLSDTSMLDESSVNAVRIHGANLTNERKKN